MSTHHQTHARAVALAIAGTALVILYALWAGIQILVLNPLAAVPGSTLAQIRVDLENAGETFAEAYVIGILAVGVVLAAIALVSVALWKGATPASTALMYCGILALGAFGYFWASFGPGMSLADTYAISGGDVSPWALPLYIVSVLALMGAMLTLVVSRPRPIARGVQPAAG